MNRHLVNTKIDTNGSGDCNENKNQEEVEEKMETAEEMVEMSVYQRCLPYLYCLRDPVAEYQTKRGIKKDEQHTDNIRLISFMKRAPEDTELGLLYGNSYLKMYNMISVSYTFCDLVTAVGQYMYNSVSAMGKMVSNLLPIFDASLLIVRFILDKIIEIMESSDKDRLKKTTLFFIEFIPIFFIIGFIYGFIFMPLYALFTTVLWKLWNFII